MRINYIYYLVIILVILCSESIGQISAILFSNEARLAVTFAFIIHAFSVTAGNILVPVRRLHYSIQYISDLSFLRLAFDTCMTAIYGFDRCNKIEIPVVLKEMGISEQMFWRKIIYFILFCIALKLFTVLLLIFKINYKMKDNRRLKEVENRVLSKSNKIIF